MYFFPEMIDMGLRDGETWPSPAHQRVAINLLIGNSAVTTRQQLSDYCAIINSKSEEEIKKMTLVEFMALGIPYSGA